MDIKVLDNEIKTGKLKNVYFFYGPETFLMENKINSIKKRILEPELEAFGLSKFSGKDAKFSEFEEEWGYLPLGVEKKLILIKDTGWLNNSKTTEFKEMKYMIENLPEYLHLIIAETDFDKKKLKNIDFIEEKGGIVFFDLLSVNQLSSWIDKLFENREKTVSPSDIAYIINASNQSMGRIYNEVEKLCIFSGDNRKIEHNDIEMLVSKSSEYKIYELFEDVLERRSEKATEKLKTLLDGGEKPTVIISGISGRLYELLLVKLLKEDRLSAKEISSYLDFPRPDFVINKMITQSSRFSEGYLKKMIKKAISFDRDIKNGRISGSLAAEMLVAELVKA